jgi:hypothetical protein
MEAGVQESSTYRILDYHVSLTLAHVIKYYLESNPMAASPSSHLDSLYADLQMHALSVSDGLAKVLTALGSGSLTTPDRYRSNYSS